MLIAKTLSFYKQKKIREAIIKSAEHKEVAVKFKDYFGKRPEALFEPGDVLEFAKKKATSFHVSEELWSNPLNIKTGMNKNEIKELIIGWDLILDIDCPYWPLSKIITHLFIKALKEHGITGISVKYSGNKGFHIAVPFESFPKKFKGEETKNLFPEAPRKIALYLLDYITNHYVEEKDKLFIFDKKYGISKDKLSTLFNKTPEQLTKTICLTCKKTVTKELTTEYSYFCSNCGYHDTLKNKIPVRKCPKCNNRMPDPEIITHTGCDCQTKEETNHVKKFNILSIVEVDTILIAHRHLYRAPYSFHEKSGLISKPIKPEEVLSFKKEMAKPENINSYEPFPDRTKAKEGEATKLLIEAYDYQPETNNKEEQTNKEYEIPTEAIPEAHFPPCIKNILKGLKDGRKRALFTLINFLRSSGWTLEAIEERIKEWNKANEEPLREVLIKGRIRYEKTRKPLPPHNCKSYYQDLGVCHPDRFCEGIKNPLQYAKKKGRRKKQKKETRKKLTEEQKKKRKNWREKHNKERTEKKQEETTEAQKKK